MAETIHLLDFDGTVVDDMAALAALGAYTIHKHFNARLGVARGMYWDTVGRPFKQQLVTLGFSIAAGAQAVKEYEGAKVGLTMGSPPTGWFSKFIARRGVEVMVVSSTQPTLLQGWFEGWYPFVLGTKIKVVQCQKAKYLSLIGGRSYHADLIFYGDTEYDEELANRSGIKFVRVK